MAVLTKHPQPGLERRWKKLATEPVGDGGDPYTGYDRFERVEQMFWRKQWAPESFQTYMQVQWGYNRASQKTWRKDLLAPGTAAQDQYYGYDGLNQLKERHRGVLNVNETSVSGIPAQQENYQYDETGNWLSYREMNNGDVTTDQTRVNNRSNQITQIDGSAAGISYDRHGNMLQARTPSVHAGDNPGMKWDAWNRMVEVRNQTTNSTITTYQYDGLTRRVVTDHVNWGVKHYYFNDQWRYVEERAGTSEEASNQWIWNPSNRWDAIAWDKLDIDWRVYAMKDDLDVAAICTGDGNLRERYTYDGFGSVLYFDAAYGPLTFSHWGWPLLFHVEFMDAETGWYNYGYRYYVPDLGRWLSRDPLGERGGVNYYTFVVNDPAGLV